MNRTVKRIIPKYMQAFKCIGAACEDCCCIGWNVDIDQQTYLKYKKIRDTELTPIIEKHLKRNRSAPDEDRYGKLKLSCDLRCPFLDERNLCKMQLVKGEKYLSKVCSSYPRNTNEINGVLECAATMSCPEAARLALLDPDGIEFVEDEQGAELRSPLRVKIDVSDRSFADKPEKYLWELRIFVLNVLHQRSYRLWERLIIIGLFCKRIDESVMEKRVDDIPGVIDLFTNLIQEDSFREGLTGIPVQNTLQMELLKQVADTRHAMGITGTRYLECFNDFLEGIQYSESCRVEEIGARYSAAYETYAEKFLEEHEYIFENYVVNHVFRNIFPLHGETVFDAYMLLVLNYALLRTHLIGMSAAHKGLTVDLTLKLIQSFAKEVEHNHQYIRVITELMKENNYNTMAYMAIMLKN